MPRKRQKRTHITAEAGYTQFLKSIEPIIISLADSRFQVNREEYFKEGQKSLAVAWRCAPSNVRRDCFDARAKLIVKLGSADGKSKASVEVHATFEMHFHATAPVNPAFVDRFADSDVRIVIWPYFREYVANVSGRMHIPPIVLPFGTRA